MCVAQTGTVYLVLDQVGRGRHGHLTADELARKRPTHPRALSLARPAAATLEGVPVNERAGIAYTAALMATRRGLMALTVVALLARGEEARTHWHQMSGTVEHLVPGSLAEACALVWQVLQEIDNETPVV